MKCLGKDGFTAQLRWPEAETATGESGFLQAAGQVFESEGIDTRQRDLAREEPLQPGCVRCACVIDGLLDQRETGEARRRSGILGRHG